MKSALPKVLHKIAGLPLLGHVVAAMRGAGVERIVVVTSPSGDAVRAYAASLKCESVVQDRQLGTGHAAGAAQSALGNFDGTLVIANGDMPLVTPAIIAEALKAQTRTGLAILAFEATDPAQYGRVLLTPDGFLNRIVEYKDASEPERAIGLCNGGCYAADAKKFFRWTAALKNDNAQKEYYLTDVPALARADGVKCAMAFADEVSVMGVNSRAELAQAESKFQARARARLLTDGVTMTAPETVRVLIVRSDSAMTSRASGAWSSLLQPPSSSSSSGLVTNLPDGSGPMQKDSRNPSHHLNLPSIF